MTRSETLCDACGDVIVGAVIVLESRRVAVSTRLDAHPHCVERAGRMIAAAVGRAEGEAGK